MTMTKDNHNLPIYRHLSFYKIYKNVFRDKLTLGLLFAKETIPPGYESFS